MDDIFTEAYSVTFASCKRIDVFIFYFCTENCRLNTGIDTEYGVCNRQSDVCLPLSDVLTIIIPDIYGNYVINLTCLDALGKKTWEKRRKTCSFQSKNGK
jgi:hypothetical protein